MIVSTLVFMLENGEAMIDSAAHRVVGRMHEMRETSPVWGVCCSMSRDVAE